MENNFTEKSKQLVAIAIENGLNFTYRPSFNDELDFPFDFGMEAIDTDTLENPLCVYMESYIAINLPSEANKSEDNHRRYEEISRKLCKVARPQYLVGAKDGIVSALVWCVF